MNSSNSRYIYPAKPAPYAPGLRCRGFNLVELVVVIAIVSIVISIAVPSFTEMITRMKAQGAASDLYMALVKTRSEAIKRNANVKLTMASGGKGWSIYPTQAEGTVLENHTVNGDVTLSGSATAEYNSSGRITGVVSFGVKAVMGSKSTERCVSTSLGGLPKVKKSAC